MLAAPAAPCGKTEEPHERSHYRSTGFTQPSLRDGVNGLSRALPGDEFVFVTVISGLRNVRARSGRRASADLASATDARTTRFCRTQKRRSSARRQFAHRFEKTCPAISDCAPDAAASNASRPNVRDDGQRANQSRLAPVAQALLGANAGPQAIDSGNAPFKPS